MHPIFPNRFPPRFTFRAAHPFLRYRDLFTLETLGIFIARDSRGFLQNYLRRIYRYKEENLAFYDKNSNKCKSIF